VAHGLGRVRGRVAIVTGAASGIGRATAALLAERGAALALCDVDAGALAELALALERTGARVLFEALDVTLPDAVERFAARVTATLGTPDLVVNNAGAVVYGPFLATPLEDWQHVLDVNLKGPVHLCRAFLPAMVARESGGYVVNVASAAAFFTPSEFAAYGASKHGLVGLSQALADELAPHGIGVSVVCPGFVDTPVLKRARIRGEDDPEERRRLATEFLKWRGLTAERVAGRIVWAAERGIPLVPVGIEAQALWLISRLTPARSASVFGLLRRLGQRT
jgi:NAD(P)-dependent dehydrogenase (short-subunit alcohol dehydrogenase family)